MESKVPLYCKLPNTISTFIQKEQVTFKVNCSIKFKFMVEDATNFKIEIIIYDIFTPNRRNFMKLIKNFN